MSCMSNMSLAAAVAPRTGKIIKNDLQNGILTKLEFTQMKN